MIFTSFEYVAFLGILFIIHWLLKNRHYQNTLLLVGSYVFYGYIHPWFCFLIAGITIVNFLCCLGMKRYEQWGKLYLWISIIFSLGTLGFFKYFNFFSYNISQVLTSVGLHLSQLELDIFLPVGISFYTFQALSYTIDVYRKELSPRTNFLDFALFVSLFPQLVAGPIERAKRLLPQIEARRQWKNEVFFSAWPLLIRGFLKKLVIADNVAIYVDKIYMLEHPSFLLFLVGTIGFTIQIYADFSAYTDLARGSARLFGFKLMENFNSPYLAISPADFWRRWHISFSSWIRDYLYIPLGGSRVKTKTKLFLVVMVSMGMSGLWHGAAWTFVVWGLYHGLLIIIYRGLGIGGRWQPKTRITHVVAWLTMLTLVVLGWSFFRASSISWWYGVFTEGFSWGLSGDSLIVCVVVLLSLTLYSLPLAMFWFINKVVPNKKYIHAVVYGVSIVAITILFRDNQQDFIYFQF